MSGACLSPRTSRFAAMFALSPTRSHRRGSSSASVIVLAAGLLLSISARCSRAKNVTNASEGVSPAFVSTTAAAAGSTNETGFMHMLRDFVASGFDNVPPTLTRKLLEADMRPECSLALLRTVTAFRKLEPWALRLFDATGKYPTGMLQISVVDLGAFDECLETEVSDSSGNVVSYGQYCNLEFPMKKGYIGEKEVEYFESILHRKAYEYIGFFTDIEVPFLRMGLCFLDDCTQSDLQSLVDTLKPSSVEIRVEDCVTAEPEPWSTRQIAIVAFLTVLVTVIAGATAVDIYIGSKPKAAQKGGILLRVVVAFSAATNTHALFHVADRTNPDQYSLSFLHGIRSICVGHIVLGHCYQALSITWGRLLNILIATDQWGAHIVTSAFDSVDTFFFLSGFLLCLAITKQKRSGPLVFLIAVIRRLIRICVPLFFVIMCTYVLPRFVTGPDAKGFFRTLDKEIADTWWALLLQIRNFFQVTERTLLVHLWYLSTDFQLFVLSLLILLVLKKRKKLALATFTVLSVLGCAIAAWTATNPNVLPFMTYPAYTRSIQLTTMNLYYVRPFYHAVCFFSGCMTLLVLDDFSNRKISKVPWYTRRDAPSGAAKLVAAFFERVLWSLFLAWVTLTCATGRGGFVGRFLSSSVFAPLSKLSFNVYLIHYPFLMAMLHATRERIHFSHFNQVTLFFGVLIWSYLLAYMAFLACEAPIATLDKLAFQGLRERGNSVKQEPGPSSVDTVLKLEEASARPFSARL
ncbi:nose resistant to fluoxetine protein 6-like isoform X2 [Dermacentor variabilis]|uniref:nose resistant to fluoxetine protein 6-like isoform X2 n=1 Tax=Dermacentor variabilis TaxID=34621 RepID=UPI003F5ADEA7